MPTLHLMRHAKSDWDDPALLDHERPLAPRGRRAAATMAEWMGGEGIRPRLVLCSSARRTCETLDALRPGLGEDVEVLVEDGLYGAEQDELLDRLRAVPAAVESVLVIGHNPGIGELAGALAGHGDPGARAGLRAKFPTAALATFAVAGAWSDLRPGAATLRAFVTPRSLMP